MKQSNPDLFEQGLERYYQGEEPEQLLPLFKQVCQQSPQDGPSWSCLAWLYLLTNHPELALRAAQKSVKLDPRAAQSRVNLALALLDNGKTGVREHIEAAKQLMSVDSEMAEVVSANIKDGLVRKPEWQSLVRVKKWILES